MVKIFVGLGASRTGAGMINVAHEESIALDPPTSFRYGIDQSELLLRNEYLLAENRILRRPSACATSPDGSGAAHAGGNRQTRGTQGDEGHRPGRQAGHPLGLV